MRTPGLLRAERLRMADGDAGQAAAVPRLPIEDRALAGKADDISDEPATWTKRTPYCRQQLGVCDAASDEDRIGRVR